MKEGEKVRENANTRDKNQKYEKEQNDKVDKYMRTRFPLCVEKNGMCVKLLRHNGLTNE